MTHTPNLPMTPDALPRQKLYLVANLPPRPEGFQGFSALFGPEPVPPELQKARYPVNCDYLCQVEWAWSPMHSRVAAWYLNPRRRHWLLWERYFDDNCDPWRWRWSLYGWAQRRPGETAEQVAPHLLIDALRNEVHDCDLDQWHWINETGTLSVGAIEAVGGVVWPE